MPDYGIWKLARQRAWDEVRKHVVSSILGVVVPMAMAIALSRQFDWYETQVAVVSFLGSCGFVFLYWLIPAVSSLYTEMRDDRDRLRGEMKALKEELLPAALLEEIEPVYRQFNPVQKRFLKKLIAMGEVHDYVRDLGAKSPEDQAAAQYFAHAVSQTKWVKA